MIEEQTKWIKTSIYDICKPRITFGAFVMDLNMEQKNEDIRMMRRALELAERGAGWVHPNPLVGAVVADSRGEIIGQGWHSRCGEAHAERNALADCRTDPEGATLYVTLEPCCHYGKTPPCTEAILAHRIARVVVAAEDPNPLMAGKGIRILREAGVEVTVGVCEAEAHDQNRVFRHYITSRQPWVTLKTAMTLDGKIATRTGDSRWVTGPEARQEVHRLRARRMAIVAGIGTVLADDPLLNVRLDAPEGPQPLRVVVDSRARIPLESRLVQTAGEFPLLVAVTGKASGEKVTALHAAGVSTLLCEEDHAGSVSISSLVARLGESGIDSVLLEGGGTLNEAFLRAGCVNEVYAFVAPKLIGGQAAKTPVEGAGAGTMREAVGLVWQEVRRIGADLLLRGYIIHSENQTEDVYGNR